MTVVTAMVCAWRSAASRPSLSTSPEKGREGRAQLAHSALPTGVSAVAQGRLGRHAPELQSEIEARPLPREESHFIAKRLARERLGLPRGGNGDDCIWMHVIDMAVRHESMQRGVDRGRAD